MKYIKLFLIGLAVVLASNSACAEPDPESLAIEYLKLTKTRETIDSTIEAYVQQFAAQNEKIDKNKLREFFNTYMGWDAIKDETVKIVANTLTVEELKDANDFYRSKSGASLAEKSPIISAAVSSIIGNNLKKALQKMQSMQK